MLKLTAQSINYLTLHPFDHTYHVYIFCELPTCCTFMSANNGGKSIVFINNFTVFTTNPFIAITKSS